MGYIDKNFLHCNQIWYILGLFQLNQVILGLHYFDKHFLKMHIFSDMALLLLDADYIGKHIYFSSYLELHYVFLENISNPYHLSILNLILKNLFLHCMYLHFVVLPIKYDLYFVIDHSTILCIWNNFLRNRNYHK